MKTHIVLILLIICTTLQEKTTEKWEKLKGTIKSQCIYIPTKGDPIILEEQIFLDIKTSWNDEEKKQQELNKQNQISGEKTKTQVSTDKFIYIEIGEDEFEEIKISRKNLESFRIEDLYTMNEIDSEIVETHFLTCEYDEKHMYISKDVLRLEQICVKIEKETSKQVGSKNNSQEKSESIKTRFTNLKQNKNDIGGFGVVRKYLSEINGVSSQRAIKRVPREKLKIKEIFILKIMSENNHGVKFYGCEFDNEHVYIEQEGLVKDLDDLKFREKFLTLNQEKQLDFIIELVEAVREFTSKKFAHCDLKLDNVMLDEKEKPRLIDYGASVPILGRQSGTYSSYYLHPQRFKYNKILPFYDLYSIAQMFVALMNKSGTQVFGYIWNEKQTTEKVDISCKGEAPKIECLNNYKNIILGSFQEKWGNCDESKKNLALMNLTELLLEIVVNLNIEIDLDDFLMHLKRIKTNKIWVGGKKIEIPPILETPVVENVIKKPKFVLNDVINTVKKNIQAPVEDKPKNIVFKKLIENTQKNDKLNAEKQKIPANNEKILIPKENKNIKKKII